MQDKKASLVLIINPVSGTQGKKRIPALAEEILGNDFNLDIRITDSPGHAKKIAESAVIHHTELVVIAGGDGTINEAAGALVNSKTSLGIIPLGSGNGLARHLKIPMNPRKAMKILASMKTLTIDAGMANDKPFFCTAGFGFDAYIGHEFMHGKSRGLYGYTSHVIKEYFRYLPSNYQVKLNGKFEQQEAFIITVANAGQYGNNAHIAPDANLCDGLLDYCVIRNFPKFKGIKMSVQLFSKKINKSPYYSNTKIKSVHIGADENTFYHLDGEIFPMDKILEIGVMPQCLRVIVP